MASNGSGFGNAIPLFKEVKMTDRGSKIQLLKFKTNNLVVKKIFQWVKLGSRLQFSLQ